MTRKSFEGNHKVEFTRDPNAPAMGAIIPEMRCDEAVEKMRELEQVGQLGLGELLMLMNHLSDDELPHEPGCPVEDPANLSRTRELWHEIMD